MAFSCMAIRMDERCNCADAVCTTKPISGYEHCDNCGHSLAAHGQLKRDRTPADPRANAAQTIAQARTDAQAETSSLSYEKVKAVLDDLNPPEPASEAPVTAQSVSGELSASDYRRIARENGIAVTERGRVHPDVKAAVHAIIGGEPVETVAPKPTVASSGLDIARLRARLVKANVPGVGKRGRLSPAQIELAQTLED